MRITHTSTFAFLSFAITFGLLTVLTGCASGPQTRTDRDPAVDMKAYRSFGFYDPAVSGGSRYTTIMYQRLEAATRTQLERFGYRYDADSPELRVNFRLYIVDRQELRSTNTSVVRPVRYGGWVGYGGVETVNYRQGTLVIDLVDANRQALVWRGVAEGRLTGKVVNNPGAAVDTTVKEVFAKFPDGAHR